MGKKMRVTEQIEQKLRQAFQPQVLEVFDESEAHRGHAGYREGGQSHFRVVIQAGVFGDQSRIARHRAVHRALGTDLVGRIHALSLEISG